MMRSGSIGKLRIYIRKKRERLAEIQKELQGYPEIYKIFGQKNWFSKVESQISLWEKDLKASLRERRISVPEYELFRYLEDDSFLKRFIRSFAVIERNTKTDRTKYRQWKGSKNQLFSSQVSQIYSTLFEMLVLAKLVLSSKNVEPYHENIDGRIWIANRFVYFEIKSLQRSRFDLKGIGVGGTQHDEWQINSALAEKALQLAPYKDKPTLVLLSLYRLADMTTADWYAVDFFRKAEGKGISGVAVYGWFTAAGEKKVFLNPNASMLLTASEERTIKREL
jgi:hypothetical protein